MAETVTCSIFDIYSMTHDVVLKNPAKSYARITELDPQPMSLDNINKILMTKLMCEKCFDAVGS